tara:strand:+ start:597 stop:818 length:222 start_codon:yes stop_codon:yes gene_type:complete
MINSSTNIPSKKYEVSSDFLTKVANRLEDLSNQDYSERLTKLEKKWDFEIKLMDSIILRIDSLISNEKKSSMN